MFAMKPGRSIRSTRSLPRLVSRILAGATDIREGEGRAVLASGAMFFLVLAVVMILRPVREAIALESGIENVRALFFGTVGAIVLLVPAFGYLVSRVRRRVFLAVSYRACSLILLGFCLGMALMRNRGGWILGPVYYVYHSVFNLFVVSLFWAFMADLFTLAQSKRLFPAIAVGGTLGAIAGSMISRQLVNRIGVASLFLVAIGLLEAAVWMASVVAATRARHSARSTEARALGGHWLSGITSLVRSPYLLGIGLFIILTAVTSTFLYFTELRLVRGAAESVEQRAVLFANINVWTQVATLLAQVFVAGRIMRLVGVGTALALLPVCCTTGFMVVAAVPTLATYTLVNALFRAVQRGVTRPARETLFTVVNREDKYKAKSVLDTFVARAGDASGAQLERLLEALGLGVTGLAVTVLPIALCWATLSLLLGAAQSRLKPARESGTGGPLPCQP